MLMHFCSPLPSDSAVVYRNEQHIGEALKTLLPKYHLRREDVFITSKLSESQAKCLQREKPGQDIEGGNRDVRGNCVTMTSHGKSFRAFPFTL
jgi:hypothetical protein